jgi:hypothetical protein
MLILKRAPIESNLEDYCVLEDGVVIGRIFKSPGAPQDRQWMWATGHNGDIRKVDTWAEGGSVAARTGTSAFPGKRLRERARRRRLIVSSRKWRVQGRSQKQINEGFCNDRQR